MTLRIRLLVSSALALFVSTTMGQTKLTDSLELKLSTVQANTKVDVLNRLTYEFISYNSEKVLTYSNQALELSNKLGYIKGEGIAHAYRGVYEYLSGQFPLAHINLHQGIVLSSRVGDKTNVGYCYLQLGNCSLEEVENDSALFYFQKSYEIFKDSTNPSLLSKIYRNMSAVYGQRYQYDKQQAYLDRAIAIRKLMPDKTLLADALAVQANNKLRVGNSTGAEELLDEADKILKDNPDDKENLNDVRHLRALILFQKGDFEEALVLFDSARNYYFKAALLRKYVTLLIDLGKVFSDRGEYELALNNFYDALKLSKLRGFDAESYTIRYRIGWVNFRLGDLNQALQLANEALNANIKKPLQSDLANALTLKGVVLTELKRFDQARSSLDSVLTIYKSLDNKRGMSETLMNLGELAARQNKYEQGLQYYRESIRLAEETGYSYGLAWSNWGMGDIHFRQGNFQQASICLDRSENFSRLINANEILILNFNTRRDLLAAQNRFKESLEFAKLASALKDSIHRSDLVRRFVNLEKIQEIEQRDRNIEELRKDKQLAESKIHIQESKLRQQFILLVAGLISLALIGALAFVYYRFYKRIKGLNITITENHKRIQAQADKLQAVNSELNHLYREVSEKSEEIQAQANKLSESNKSISDLNRRLEIIVAEKTLELRTANQELVKHNNELLQFSYTVSHNLRGPVARLLGLSDLAQAEADQQKANAWINLIHKTAGELDMIIKDLSKILDLRNEPHRYRETIDLEAEWNQSASLLQDSLTGQEEIVTNFREVPKLMSVRAMIQSVFYNLLSNAIKFKSPERNLKVVATSRRENDKVVLEVVDNGLGFDTKLHEEKLFKLYKRFHSHVEGRGLGLYLIKSQIEVLHGTIEVESTPGRGSLFRITLPIEVNESLTIMEPASQVRVAE